MVFSLFINKSHSGPQILHFLSFHSLCHESHLFCLCFSPSICWSPTLALITFTATSSCFDRCSSSVAAHHVWSPSASSHGHHQLFFLLRAAALCWCELLLAVAFSFSTNSDPHPLKPSPVLGEPLISGVAAPSSAVCLLSTVGNHWWPMEASSFPIQQLYRPSGEERRAKSTPEFIFFFPSLVRNFSFFSPVAAFSLVPSSHATHHLNSINSSPLILLDHHHHFFFFSVKASFLHYQCHRPSSCCLWCHWCRCCCWVVVAAAFSSLAAPISIAWSLSSRQVTSSLLLLFQAL